MPAQARHKVGEGHQVRNPEQRTSLPHNDFRIRRGNVGPFRRNGANSSVVDAQQETLAGAVIAFTNTDELPAAERVERVGYTDKLRRSGGKVCIPR